MNHYEVLNACQKALHACRAEGHEPMAFLLPPASLEALRRFPVNGVMVAAVNTLSGVPVKLTSALPRLRGTEGTIYLVTLPEEAAPVGPVTLTFDIRIRGVYTPSPELYGLAKDPEQWAALDEQRITKDLPRFVSILPTIAPDADIEVHVEPAKAD